ncbi:UNVERIFIED_CONTAM: hypothetical protein FKN15_054114 [Acipenser sinensis]
MDPRDIAAIQSLKGKSPATVGELRKLMGLLGYYRQYVKDFSKLAKPLYELLTVQGDNGNMGPKLKKSGKEQVTGQAMSSQPIN